VSAAWIAGSVRARLLVVERRLGAAGARSLAAAPSLPAAIAALGRTPYRRELGSARSLAEVQRAVAAKVLVELRLLAGWLPGDALGLLRALAGWYELANVEDRLAYLAGAPARPPFELGSLAVAWPRASGAQSLEELRAALASSSWGDPGGETPTELGLGLRLALARRVAAEAPEASSWAAGAAALLVARELYVVGLPVELLPLPAVRLLGSGWSAAATFDRFAAALPPAAAWPLDGVAGAGSLWRAEAHWWQRVEQEARRLLASQVAGRATVLGASALLAADARRVSAALAVAARRGLSGVEEVFDAAV